MTTEQKTGPVLEPEAYHDYWLCRIDGVVGRYKYLDLMQDRLDTEAGRILHDEESAHKRLTQQGRWVPFADAVKPEEVEEATWYFWINLDNESVDFRYSGYCGNSQFEITKKIAKEGRLFPFTTPGFLAAERKADELKQELTNNQ